MGEWREVKLGDLIAEGSAFLQTGPFGTALNASEYVQNGTPVIAVQDIGENQLVHNKFVFVDDSVAARLAKYQVREHDIIFGRKGAVERRALIKKGEENWLQGSDCIRLRFDKTVNPAFISYQLGTPMIKDWMFQNSSGATMPSLNQEILKLLPLKLPPLPTQRAIAATLGSLDDKIALLARQNRTLEGLAGAVWRGWFGENEGWDEKGLDEIAEFLNGLPCQKYPPVPGAEILPVIKIKELRTGITEASDLATANVPKKYIVEDGDTLFSWSGSLELVLWIGGKGVLNQHLFKVIPNGYPDWFCFFWIKEHLPDFRQIAEDKATTMGHIQRKHLTDAPVFVPSPEKLVEMGKIISPYFQKIKTNQRQIRTLTALRDAMLPKLMSGEMGIRA